MFDVGLRPMNRDVPFERQLPVFNMFYPVDFDGEQLTYPLAKFEKVDWHSIRRTAAYFHIPFCETICTFCPFSRSGYNSNQDVEDYVEALIREMILKASYVGRLKVVSVSIGGGTPSILTPSQIKRFGENVQTYLDITDTQEYSVEVEVKSVTREKLLAFKDIGVNRISFGAQTFSPQHRKMFGLDAQISQIQRVADWANELFPYTNVDLIYGIAGQSVTDPLTDADKAIQLGTTTIDFYPLNNLSSQTRLHRAFEKNGLELLTARQRLDQRRAIVQHMNARQYTRINGYSFAPRRGTSKKIIQDIPKYLYHDILYGYHDEAVVGYGSAAISHVPGYNFHVDSNRQKYVSSMLEENNIPLSAFDVGIVPEKGVVTFPYRGDLIKSRVPWEAVPNETLDGLKGLVLAGLVKETKKTYELTEQGWLFYVNSMYYMMPNESKRWIFERVEKRVAEGHQYENVELS